MSTIEDWGSQIRAVPISMLVICWVSTALRFYVRASIMTKSLGLDDWLMLLASIIYTFFAAMSIVSIHYGLGRHEADLTPGELVYFRQYWWLCELAYGPSIIISRFSIGILFLRLSLDRLQRHLIYLVISTSAIVGILFVFLFIFQCHPVSYYWNKNQDGACLDPIVIVNFAYCGSVPSILCDLYFALLPAYLVHGLKMARGTKMALSVLLGLGCIASIAIIIRFPFLPNIAEPDFSWNAAKAGILNFTEPGLAITAGNLAVGRPFLRKIAQRLGLQTSSNPPVSSQFVPPTIGSKDIRKVGENAIDNTTTSSNYLTETIISDDGRSLNRTAVPLEESENQRPTLQHQE